MELYLLMIFWYILFYNRSGIAIYIRHFILFTFAFIQAHIHWRSFGFNHWF